MFSLYSFSNFATASLLIFFTPYNVLFPLHHNYCHKSISLYIFYKKYSQKIKKKIGEKSKNRNNKKVICIETQIIYNSITEAGIKNNINPTYIGSCANYKLKTVNGYHWSFYDEAQKEKYTLENILKIIDEKMPNKLKKKVICKETQIIYNSTTEAAKAVGILPGNITNCAKKNRKTAGGYHWEYVK